MSGFTFKTAKRVGTTTLIGLAGGTGSGKTYSALRLATGLADGREFGVIDTEAGRALHYADEFNFQHGDLGPPFTPDRYREAIVAAEAAGFPVVVVDSMSHEHAGDGGILDMHEAEWARLGHKESTKFLAWVKPKGQHKRMVSRLLQLRCHLILCFRAEPKIKLVKRGGKTEVVNAGWQPVVAKGLDFEMTASWMLEHEKPGMAAAPIKLPKQFESIFPKDQLIDERAGEKLAAWASGEVAKQSDAGSADDGDPRSIAQRIREEFVEPGVLSRDKAGRVLRGAGLGKKDDLEAAEWSHIRTLLGIAANGAKKQ